MQAPQKQTQPFLLDRQTLAFLLDLRTQPARWTIIALASPFGPFAVWRKSGRRMSSAIPFTAPSRCRRPPRTSPTIDWRIARRLGADRDPAGLAALRRPGVDYSDVILRRAQLEAS